MKNSYFSRSWVIQELALARHASDYCGKKEIYLNDFRDNISFFVENFESIQSLCREFEDFMQNFDIIGGLGPLGGRVIVDITSNLFRKVQTGLLLSQQ